MTTTESQIRAPSVHSLIDGIERGSKASRLPRRFTRRQIVDASIVLDASLVFLSFILAEQFYAGLFGTLILAGGNYALIGGFAGLVHYVVIKTNQRSGELFNQNALPRILRQLVTTFAVVIVVAYGLKQAEIHSRLWFGLAFAIAFATIAGKGLLFSAVFTKQRLTEFVAERIALFGDPSIAESPRKFLESEFGDLCQIAFYDGSETNDAGLRQLISDGLNNKFNRVIFCLPPENLGRLKGLVDAINYLPVRIEAWLAHAELQVLKKSLLVSPDHFLINLDDQSQDEWGALFKRVMDFVLGSVFLVLASPIIGLAAIAIKLDSKGPVFFRQRRHGWNHSIISVLKLRTMRVQEDGSSIKQAVQNDPRVTRVGRFLRKTSIDELPQLFNVLTGEMSLVGPRPHALAHNVLYSELIASYAVRHRVKPGITGWAQIKGLRGNSEEISAMVARAEADIWYIRHWSILLDLKIIVLTPVVMLFQKSAY